MKYQGFKLCSFTGKIRSQDFLFKTPSPACLAKVKSLRRFCIGDQQKKIPGC